MHRRVHKTNRGGGIPASNVPKRHREISPQLKQMKTKVAGQVFAIRTPSFLHTRSHMDAALKNLKKKQLHPNQNLDSLKNPFVHEDR